jgi:hypothetical protein
MAELAQLREDYRVVQEGDTTNQQISDSTKK